MPNSIAGQTWEKVSINEIIHTFLVAELEKVNEAFNGQINLHEENISKIIANPDFKSEHQNCLRSMLLVHRLGILKEIPSSTIWHKVSSINESHYNELFAINDKDWVSSDDKNELPKVAKRMNIKLTNDPSTWQMPILWGKSKKGPFTIIEGNHRFSAIALTDNKFNIPCYIGLSGDFCPWHLSD